jgi:hypothetical protein
MFPKNGFVLYMVLTNTIKANTCNLKISDCWFTTSLCLEFLRDTICFAESAGAAHMETYTTDDALTLMGFGKFQALVLAYAGMGWVAEAMEVMLLSFLGPVVREEWNVSPQDESLLSSVVFAGMLIGACAWGFISDRYGRK